MKLDDLIKEKKEKSFIITPISDQYLELLRALSDQWTEINYNSSTLKDIETAEEEFTNMTGTKRIYNHYMYDTHYIVLDCDKLFQWRMSV